MKLYFMLFSKSLDQINIKTVTASSSNRWHLNEAEAQIKLPIIDEISIQFYIVFRCTPAVDTLTHCYQENTVH